jgi:hypothetical protein
MKLFYAFIFASFVSLTSVGQITLLTPATDAPYIYTDVNINGYFPNNTTSYVYNLSSSGTSNSYSLSYFPGGGYTRYILISRMPNGKWRMRANIAFAGVFYYDVAVYETVESYDTVDPPCDALYQLTTNNNGVFTIVGQYQLQFSTPCGNTNLPSICAIDYNPKLINLANMTHTIMNGLTAADGLRQGSIAYNNNANRMKYYDGVKWNDIYSPSNSLSLKPNQQIVFEDGTNNINHLILSKNSANQLELNQGIKVVGASFMNGALKSDGAITEKATFRGNGNSSTPFPIATSVIVFNGTSNNSLTIPSAIGFEVGRIYTIKNLTQFSTITFLGSSIKSTATVNVTSLTAGQSIRIMSDGTNWITI